ncbi:hypothetical protein [Anaerotruncus colihominis]|uniref:Uncharacterized protein n=1 Tax=Anaerotruncus colihominis TaxID=169435 RepID=A0A845T2T6_9FIRM|nr:hypothetical protein [Anaerotruncus colihominis]MCR2026485.1 hypothetical protein [Anaerotruncus colihominis]NDO40792.1 hypothetical protein [Anaerotruncus colihominis]
MIHLKRLAVLATAVCTLWAVAVPTLAVQTPGGLDIDQTGDLVNGSYVYRSSVTLTLVPEHPQDTLLIEDGGVWMELTPDKDQNYTLTFRQPREYALRFCTQASDGTRGEPRAENFTIDPILAQLIDDSRALPNLLTATDSEVEAQRAKIMDVQSRWSDLTESQRALFPVSEQYRLTKLVGWLSNMQPTIDVHAPDTPTIVLTGAKAPNANVFSGKVDVEVRPATLYDLELVCIRENDGWQYIEPTDGVYTVSFTKPGSYAFDICIRDAVGNHSPARRVAFTISNELCTYLTKVSTAAGADAEAALIEYYAMPAALRAQVDAQVIKRLQTLCGWQYDAYNLGWQASAGERPVRAVGMLGAFLQGGVRFSVTGAPSSQSLPNVAKQTLYAYSIAFIGADGGAAVPQSPILIRAVLPRSLLGKKGVQMYDDTGAPLQTRVKSEDEGIVLEFTVARAGAYYMTADM